VPTLSHTLNLGILAHVDAGKTSLTERLLYAAGVIDAVGRVDDGSTQTDTLELERRRGITIKSAVVSFTVPSPAGETIVNLIDTPGHPDFIAEVERVLGVLDGAVLVVSAVEGVQAQTRVLFRTLRRLGLPVIVFVNKTDRVGADVPRVLDQIRARLTPYVVPMPLGGNVPVAVDVLTVHDDELLAAYVDGIVDSAAVQRALVTQSRAGAVVAAYAGSAITGDGVDALLGGIAELLPSQCPAPDGEPSGVVFKVERGPAGEKIAYTQIVAGTLRVRGRISIQGTERKVTAIQVFDDGASVPRPAVEAGRIAKVWGLTDVRIGDPIGSFRPRVEHHFAPPTLETVVVPGEADRTAVYAALAQLAEQDPLINLRQSAQEIFLSLYGEVQKEVIQSTLAEQYALEVSFRETTMICAERVSGVGAAAEYIFQNPFLATVGLRVEPGTPGSGITVRLDVPVESMPLYVYKSVDVFRQALTDHVRETLQQGLHGWAVDDCVVTLTDCDYSPPGTTAADYRKLVPLVLMDALREAGTVVCEPIHRLTVEGPDDGLSAVLRLLAQYGATPYPPSAAASRFELTADVPAAQVHAVQQRLPALTRGEGVLESAFDHYRPVRGPAPERARTDLNPLNRKEYLLHVLRRL
jgi:ribosomal protection tetracycline resistance protein